MQVQEVRAELAPWDKKIAEAESQVKLATTERDLVTQQQQEARKRLQVVLLNLSSIVYPALLLPTRSVWGSDVQSAGLSAPLESCSR